MGYQLLFLLRDDRVEMGNNVPSTVYSRVSSNPWCPYMQHSKKQEPLFKYYLSRYCAATTATYARRPRHRASFVQASIPFAHSVSPWCPALYIFIFPSSLRSEQFRVQMISIVQTQPTPRLLKLLRRQALERSLRGHGHENRQRHGAMWEVQRCCSRARRL